MRMRKKLLSVLMVLSVVLSVFSVYTQAETLTEGNQEEQEIEMLTYENPLYSGGGDINIEVVPSQPMFLLDWDEEDYYTNIKDAAKNVREQMKKRQSLVTVCYKADLSDNVNEIATDIWTKALEHTGVATEGDYLRWQWGTMRLGASGFIYGGLVYYTFQYNVSYYTDAEQEAAMDTAVSNLLSELDLDDKSDYEKCCKVYEWLCKNITYDYENLNDDSYKLKHSAYAALINRTSVCQGYAVLLYRLMLELGIDCRVISGIGNGENHAWNIIQLDDKYFNADATFDTSYYQVYKKYQYFLRSDENFDDHERDEEYTKDEFYGTYPMGSENYSPEASAILLGDVNEDGKVNTQDRMILTRYIGKWDGYTQDKINMRAADVNEDGKINTQDRMILTRYIAKWVGYEKLPYSK